MCILPPARGGTKVQMTRILVFSYTPESIKDPTLRQRVQSLLTSRRSDDDHGDQDLETDDAEPPASGAVDLESLPPALRAEILEFRQLKPQIAELTRYHPHACFAQEGRSLS